MFDILLNKLSKSSGRTKQQHPGGEGGPSTLIPYMEISPLFGAYNNLCATKETNVIVSLNTEGAQMITKFILNLVLHCNQCCNTTLFNDF